VSFDYGRMPIPLRWEWHAEIYAMRRVLLGVPHDTHTSPCDTKGEWYNESAVARAEAKLRGKLAEQAQRCKANTDTENASRFAEAEAWRKQRDGHAEAAE
jgi:hypothetical protein